MSLTLHPQDPAFERMDELVFWNHVLANPDLWLIKEDPILLAAQRAEIIYQQFDLIYNDYGGDDGEDT